jgi:hypothetical protein
MLDRYKDEYIPTAHVNYEGFTIYMTKEVAKEEIEVEAGTYYYKCDNDIYHKLILEEEEDGCNWYRLEIVELFSDVKGLRIKEDSICDENEIPYKFSGFIREISGKKLKKNSLNSKNKKY